MIQRLSETDDHLRRKDSNMATVGRSNGRFFSHSKHLFTISFHIVDGLRLYKIFCPILKRFGPFDVFQFSTLYFPSWKDALFLC